MVVCMLMIALAISVSGCTTTQSHATARHGYSDEVTSVFLPRSGGALAWPVRGDVIAHFDTKVGSVRNNGIDIRVAEGTAVRAAQSGRVVFCDEYFRGFGKTVIIDHGNSLQTVYAYNTAILVRPGDVVDQNTVIARAGRTGRARTASLHFEVCKDGRPQNPMFYLSR